MITGEHKGVSFTVERTAGERNIYGKFVYKIDVDDFGSFHESFYSDAAAIQEAKHSIDLEVN